ncbi:hypothetical protein ACR79P_06505 [Sphingobacterium spiritivorum]|uniref:hypothetical protein n=1 Tax=Sphingobacterium spiritivorum TaxID=258 RepID=UPI003DA603E0
MKQANLASLMQQYQYGINSLPFVVDYIRENFSQLEIKSVSPYSFTIGSNFNGEPISYDFDQEYSLFYGDLFLSVNPNSNVLQNEEIVLTYRSYWNTKPYLKRITRQIEIENLVNESSVSTELFDKITLDQTSSKYDVYVTFVGFKIDII